MDHFSYKALIMSFSRSRLLAVTLTVLALGACSERTLYTPKHLRSVLPETRELMQTLGIDKHSPILMRVFKAEGKLEVWKRTRKDERFALLKTYDICRWSGDLGPKRKEGDRQAPEGFYAIAPAQLNPRSSYFLAFDTGYPNAFDRAHERTGSNLMVHGDCSSRGCFAMTDTQMQEIFALARDAFDGGQRAYQMQIFPFRLNPQNLHRFRNNENIAFWRMLKEGSDHFETTLREPEVQVCDKRYVFNQRPHDPAAKFSPSEACPASEVPADLQQLVAQRRHQDALKLAEIAENEHQRGLGTPPHPPQLASHTPLPPHAVYTTRKLIRAHLPLSGPEALSLLPGAEAGPTPELRQIARGEVKPIPETAENDGNSPTLDAGPVIAVATPVTPNVAPRVIASNPVGSLSPAPASPGQTANLASAASGPTIAAAGPAPITPETPAISGLFSRVISAFAPTDQRSEESVLAIPTPNAPRPLPSPLRSALPHAPAAQAKAEEPNGGEPQSHSQFLEKTFGSISLPGFGKPATQP